MKQLLQFIFILLIALVSSAKAEILLGNVTKVDEKAIIVKLASKDVVLQPGEIVLFQAELPGLDEKAESGKGKISGQGGDPLEGYIDTEVIVGLLEGEPGIGDQALLRKGQIAKGTHLHIEQTWWGMRVQDKEHAARAGNVAAMCALAQCYEQSFCMAENDTNTAMSWYKRAMLKSPPADCAYRYARNLTSMGVKAKNEGARKQTLKEAEKWSLYAAEQGHEHAMMGYALLRSLEGDIQASRKWYQQAAKSEKDSIRKSAEHWLKDLDRK